MMRVDTQPSDFSGSCPRSFYREPICLNPQLRLPRGLLFRLHWGSAARRPASIFAGVFGLRLAWTLRVAQLPNVEIEFSESPA